MTLPIRVEKNILKVPIPKTLATGKIEPVSSIFSSFPEIQIKFVTD